MAGRFGLLQFGESAPSIVTQDGSVEAVSACGRGRKMLSVSNDGDVDESDDDGACDWLIAVCFALSRGRSGAVLRLRGIYEVGL